MSDISAKVKKAERITKTGVPLREAVEEVGISLGSFYRHGGKSNNRPGRRPGTTNGTAKGRPSAKTPASPNKLRKENQMLRMILQTIGQMAKDAV